MTAVVSELRCQSSSECECESDERTAVRLPLGEEEFPSGEQNGLCRAPVMKSRGTNNGRAQRRAKKKNLIISEIC